MNLLLVDIATIANIVDIVIILLFILFLIVGLAKGFMETLFKFIGSIGAIFVGIIFAKPTLKFVNDKLFNLNAFFGKLIQSSFSGITGLNEKIADIGKEAIIENIKTQLASNKILQNILINIVNSYEGAGDITALEWITSNVGGIIATIAVAIAIAIIVSIIVFILVRIFRKHEDKNGGKFILDRVFGGLFGLVKCFIFVAVAVSVATLVGRIIPPVSETLEQTKIARIPYEIVDSKIDDAEQKVIDWVLEQIGIKTDDTNLDESGNGQLVCSQQTENLVINN